MAGRTMDAVDNPSYFTVPGSGKFSMLRRRGLGVSTESGGHSPPVSPTAAFPNRRLSRTLLRSVSAQSDASLLVLGNPRLCDLAPAHRPSSATDLLQPDDDGEIFLYPDGDARYYNLQAASKRTGGRRRHSFGEFLRTSSTSSPQQQPLEPKKCHSSRKRCDKCSEKVTKSSELLDIVIVSSKVSEAAALWVSYLTNCFQQVAKERSRQPFKLVCVAVEDVVNGVMVGVQPDTILKARLQLVILCPVFLQCVSVPGAVLGSLLQPGHVLAMLLGVTDEDVTLEHRTALLCYDQWQRQIVKDQDPMFVGDFLGTAMDILSRSWQLQQAINQSHKDENKALFSVLPKKIKMGQNKLLILLVNPLETTDNVQITIDKNGQKLEISTFKKRNPYTLQFVVPATCLQVSMLVTVVVEKNGKPLGHRLVKCESLMRELDQLLRSSDNPLQFMCQTLGLSPGDRDQLDTFLAAAFQQNMPPHFNLLRLTGLRHHSSCEEFPTLLHFAARHGLEKLSWQLLDCAGGEQACQMRNTCQLTPADLAERAGHTRLAHTLKSFLQMTELSSMYSYLKGMSEKQANDVILNCSNYLLPRPLDNTYSIPPSARPVLSSPLPNTSQPTSPQPHQYTNIDSYQVPPSPVSVADNFLYNIPSFPIPLSSPMDNYQVPGQAIPYNPPTPPTPSSPLDALPPGGYMEMQSPTGSNRVGSANKLRGKMTLNLPHHEYLNCPSLELSDDHYLHNTEDILIYKTNEKRHRISSHSSNSGKSSSMSAQDELVEIINDFKNNVFTIAEVEKLVESWQNRHDVQQSFKEKQKQLNEMREEYDKIQHAIKENMKRTTPFERIRRFFTKGKSRNCGGACKGKTATGCSSSPTTAVSNRPASSLSLHSSCSSTSSGRMSTGSGTSLGDSGTHSDSDERKLNEIGKPDLRSKILSGKLYTEIPQRDMMKAKEDPESDRRVVECLSLSCGANKPFLYRSNSIQENTIEEEAADETKLSKDQSLQQQQISVLDKEITMVDVHNIPCDTCRNIAEVVKEIPEKLPLPPPVNSSIKGTETTLQIEECSNKTNNSIPEQLLIIEDNEIENVNSDKSELIKPPEESEVLKEIHECDMLKTNCESGCMKQNLQSDFLVENHHSKVAKPEVDGEISIEQSSLECKSKGYVKNIVNIIENDNNFDILDASTDICEHILDSAETEVLFELPDYVNVTLPPVHPCTSCEDITK